MLFRTRVKPLAMTLGAATVLAIGGAVPVTTLASAPASAADSDPTTDPGTTDPGSDPGSEPTDPPDPTDPPTDPPDPTDPPTDPPDPTDPPTDPPGDGGGDPAPSLTISMSLSATAAPPGGSVTATVKVSAQNATAHNAVLRLSASSASVLSPGGLGDLGSASRSIASVVTIPATHGAGPVTVTASISADRATTRKTSRTVNVTTSAAGVANLGTSGAGTALPLTAPGSGLPGAAPVSLPGAVQPQLPLIGQPPAVAPKLGQPGTPTALRSASSLLGTDDTMFRLVLTQVAWLSALLVFMSVLLTQLRLKRRRPSTR